MSQSKTNNQKPHILQNHTPKNYKADGKFRVGTEGSSPIQLCNQNNKNNKKLRISSTYKKMFSTSCYKCGTCTRKEDGVKRQDGKGIRKD